jgi:hypothetical protein
MRHRAAIAVLLLLLACSRDTIDRQQWERMPQHDRVLYVKSLIGAERVKTAKGGGGLTYDRPAEVYVMEIDRAYAGGEQRPVKEVFAGLGR